MTIWRRQWHPTAVFLPGKSYGRRSLVGCSPWGHKESDTTERLHFHISLSCTGQGNGNPLQCSCLENPRDGGVCGVAQSRTRLKRLSSSSSSQYSCQNPMDRGAWQATVHTIVKSQTQLSNFHFSFSCIGEGNGNPFQCSCLENPGDGGAWWASVYGVAQSRT